MRPWRDFITVDRRRDHNRWINTGREGGGPLQLVEDIDLSGIRLSGTTFEYSTFRKCRFSDTGIEYSRFNHATFIECVAETANLSHCRFNEAVFTGCTLPRVDFRWGHFVGSRLESTTFDGAAFSNAGFVGATLAGNSFRGCAFADTQIDKSHLLDCDLRDTILIGSERGGRTYETHFENCDFRGADFTDRRFRDTTFTRCKFAGVKGLAIIEGPVHVIEPDFSDAGDGSDVRNPDAVLAMWADRRTT